MKNRQSIILWYENVIRKINKLSFDTFLKTINAEMNAPDPIFICIKFSFYRSNVTETGSPMHVSDIILYRVSHEPSLFV